MGRVWSLPVSLFLVLVGGCDSKRRNPNVCCTTQADCEAIGANPDDFRCGDGFTCIANECVEQTACQAPSDCPSATPECIDGTCVQCTTDEQCGALKCDTSTNSCVECVDSSDCDNQACDAATNTCKPCTSSTECASGYCELPAGTCRGDTIVPKFVPAACDVPASNDLVDGTSRALDTIAECNAGVVTQSGGPEICVVRFRSYTLSGAATLTVTGPRALALVVDTDLHVEGTLDISATGRTKGPGTDGTSGGDSSATTGGGGSGGATPGASGGGFANNGGPAVPVPTLLSGGRSAGGGGGGAATLVSCRGAVSVTGLIDAGGGGGNGGRAGTGAIGAGGGGSGGTVVLQGMNISVTGRMFANGGAGGSGGSGGVFGVAGSDGSSSLLPATGAPAQNGSGAGGDGGVEGTFPTAGGNPTVSNATPGGGGGSVGFFLSFTPAGINPVIMPLEISPRFHPNSTLSTK